ncbi:MAG: DNA alkylation repair protein [bacterium]|jgi:3-methyladenine DNA glycosylase AlkD
MTLQEVMAELEQMGSEQTKKVLMKHGAREPFFGVKVGDLKKIVKKVKKDHELSIALFNTGNSDAMYLAGLIADEKKISGDQLQDWAEKAYWYMLSEYTVAWVAAESRFGHELGMEWIEADEENIASAGWATLANYLAITQNEELDLQEIDDLLECISKTIKYAPNRVRYAMNGFVIAAGSYIPELTNRAIEIAEKIGKVEVEMGGTACKVPSAPEYIKKVKDAGKLGKKKKVARC